MFSLRLRPVASIMASKQVRTSLGILFIWAACEATASESNFSALESNYTPSASSSEDRLIWTLLGKYNRNARPTEKTVQVSIGFYIHSIDYLEEREQVLRVSAHIEAGWIDRRLSWNPSVWNGIDLITLPASMIWKPDFALTNTAGEIYNQVFYSSYYLVEITSSGRVSWTPSGPMKIRCVPDLTYYPFDVQTCFFRFENWAYPSRFCKLSPTSSGINLEKFIGSGEWSIVSTSAVGTNISNQSASSYSDIHYYLKLQRKTWFYKLHVIFPSALMAALACVVFLLPEESQEKITLSITVMLSFVVLLLTISSEMPTTSDHTPLLTSYITMVTCISAISLLCSIFVIRISNQGRKVVPSWIRQIVIEKLGRMLRIVPSSNDCSDDKSGVILLSLKTIDLDSRRSENSANDSDAVLSQLLESLSVIRDALQVEDAVHCGKSEWQTVSIICDRLFFIAFSLVTTLASLYILVVMPLNEG